MIYRRTSSFLVFWFLIGHCYSTACADDGFKLSPANAAILGSVQYTVVGRYRAVFERFDGEIIFDPKARMIRSVTLDIDVNSIKSSFSALDRAVRSPVLLDAKKFPHIIFKSSSIERAKEGFKVKGTLQMHGVKREVEFPFTAGEPVIVNGKKIIHASGKWHIPRREYGVIWNRLLDHGGVIVGNVITVDWQITAEGFSAKIVITSATNK